MLQLPLMPSLEPRTIVDDASGTIVYYPNVVTPELCDRWFAQLRDTIEWRAEDRPMYDRIVTVPRLVGGFLLDASLPPLLVEMRDAVERHVDARFTSVGLNYYRDGRDSVAMHNDRTGELVHHSPIALLSLGAVRTMRLSAKGVPRRSHAVALEPGSILLMAGAAQEHWEHGIPKTREPVGERISLAFRQNAR